MDLEVVAALWGDRKGVARACLDPDDEASAHERLCEALEARVGHVCPFGEPRGADPAVSGLACRMEHVRYDLRRGPVWHARARGEPQYNIIRDPAGRGRGGYKYKRRGAPAMGGGPAGWRSDFEGVAYRYYDLRMNVAPLFSGRREAVAAWHDTIRWWIEPTIRVRFVEAGPEYWLVVGADSRRPEGNVSLFRSMPMSENYERFKRGCGGEAYLRLGTHEVRGLAGSKDDDVCSCGHEGEDHGDDESCLVEGCACARFETVRVTLLHKKKAVTDIAFLPVGSIRDDSLAWNCACAHRLLPGP